MTKGDVVNGIGADNTALYYQPAAGVEVIITATDAQNLFKYDGANQGDNIAGTLNTKIAINNTNYLGMGAGGAGKRRWYSGIQVK